MAIPSTCGIFNATQVVWYLHAFRELKNMIPLPSLDAAADTTAFNERPNNLLIVADDVGYSDLGCYGGEIDTPTRKENRSLLIWHSTLRTARCTLRVKTSKNTTSVTWPVGNRYVRNDRLLMEKPRVELV